MLSYRRFLLLAAPAAVLLAPGRADALLTYNIFQSGSNVVIQTSGSLTLSNASLYATSPCNVIDLEPKNARFCTGVPPSGQYDFLRYAIDGPSAFALNSSTGFYYADSVDGTLTLLYGANNQFGIASGYVNGTSIVSSATYNNTSLAALGFTQETGLVGTWTLRDSRDTINVVLGGPDPGPASVPGPLPLLGIGAAFVWSRRLRRRISHKPTTPSEG